MKGLIASTAPRPALFDCSSKYHSTDTHLTPHLANAIDLEVLVEHAADPQAEDRIPLDARCGYVTNAGRNWLARQFAVVA
jgi:hypothetical protein